MARRYVEQETVHRRVETPVAEAPVVGEAPVAAAATVEHVDAVATDPYDARRAAADPGHAGRDGARVGKPPKRRWRRTEGSVSIRGR